MFYYQLIFCLFGFILSYHQSHPSFSSQSDVPPGKVFFESKQVSEKRSPKTGPELGSPEFRVSLVYSDTNLTL